MDCQLLVVPGGTHSYTDAAPDASITSLHTEVVQRWVESLLHPDDPAGAQRAVEELKPLEECYRDTQQAHS